MSGPSIQDCGLTPWCQYTDRPLYSHTHILHKEIAYKKTLAARHSNHAVLAAAFRAKEIYSLTVSVCFPCRPRTSQIF